MLIEALQAPHAHLLIDTSEQSGIIVDCLITTAERLQERKPEFKALARAWDTAVDHVEANPDEAIKVMAAALGGAHGDPELFAETFEKIRFYDGERNIEYFGTPEQPGPVYETAQVSIDVWTSVGALDFALTPADVIRHDLWVE